MGKLLDLNLLKQDYIGKTFNWLTVIDVIRNIIRNNKRIICFVCKCKCGAIIERQYDKVLSGHITSCGCYKHSKEKADKYREWCKNNPDKVKEKAAQHSNYLRNHPEITRAAAQKHSEWYKNNPEKTKKIGLRHSMLYKNNPEIGKAAGNKISQWYKDNPDKVKEKADNYSEYCKDHPEMVLARSEKYANWCKENLEKVRERGIKSSLWHSETDKHNNAINKLLNTCRQKRIKNTDFTALQNIVTNDTYNKLCTGEYDSHSVIDVKCPVCGNYAPHMLKNFYNLSHGKLKFGTVPHCSKCKNSLLSSKYEQEIADYISTFYNSECMYNSRDIISPLELDLYYPEKKIAIEFNGDYWHSTLYKDNCYHYNKFALCRDNGIILISIFENYWLNDKIKIKEYLRDLFNGLDNNISFKDSYMNNNYPSPNYYKLTDSYVESSYTAGKNTVYTCGYSVINNIEGMKVVKDTDKEI